METVWGVKKKNTLEDSEKRVLVFTNEECVLWADYSAELQPFSSPPQTSGSTPPVFLSKSPSDLCPPGVVSIPQHASTSELGGSPLWVGTPQSQVPDVVSPQGRWQPRDLVDAPGPVVTGTKNEREPPEEREVGGWGPETGAPAAGSSLTGKKRIMGLGPPAGAAP